MLKDSAENLQGNFFSLSFHFEAWHCGIDTICVQSLWTFFGGGGGVYPFLVGFEVFLVNLNLCVFLKRGTLKEITFFFL